MKTKYPIVVLSLATAKINRNYVITDLNEGMLFKIKRRVMEVGFFVGVKTVVLKKSLREKTFLVAVNGCVFCIRRDVAQNIYVKEVEA